MKRKDWLWPFALAAMGCLAACPAAAQEAKQAEEPDEYAGCEIRAYPVADLLIPTANYPYRENLPTLGSSWAASPALGGLSAAAISGGMGGSGMGGMGGGFYSLRDYGAQQNAAGSGMGGLAGGETAQADAATQAPWPGGSLFQSVDDLITAIRLLIDPASWADVGGSGDTAYFGGLLLVRQLPQNHEKIDELLDTIRAEGGTARTVILDAYWLPLDAGQLADLLADDSAEASGQARAAIDPAALEQLARQVAAFRGRITCFSGQTVHVASGNRRTIVVGAIPVVGSAPAYQPIMAAPNVGIVLEARPLLLPGTEDGVVDLHSTVTGWEEPDPPVSIGSRFPGERTASGLNPMARETLGSAVSIEVDRPNMPAHQLAATLRVPLGKPFLVGGLTLKPAEPESADKADRQPKQLYLVVQLSAVRRQ